MGKNKYLKISIVVLLYNAETTLLKCLESIKKQDYPIKEIIIIDNKSRDNSVNTAEDFKKNNKNLNIKIIKRKKTFGLSESYNLGAKLAEGDYLVTVHSDSYLPSAKELVKLIKPFLKEKEVVASFPILIHKKEIWLTYNFWQKILFARSIDLVAPSNNGKFDCYKKDVFLKIGGFDEKSFNNEMGTEDADMDIRIRKAGKIVPTTANVIHLHSLDKNYSMSDWIARRKFLAISYGRYIKMHAKDMKLDILYFMIKPFFVLLTVFIIFNKFFIFLIILFPFIYMKRIFTEIATLKDPRIILLPFIVIGLNYYETYWMFESLFFRKIEV